MEVLAPDPAAPHRLATSAPGLLSTSTALATPGWWLNEAWSLGQTLTATTRPADDHGVPAGRLITTRLNSALLSKPCVFDWFNEGAHPARSLQVLPTAEPASPSQGSDSQAWAQLRTRGSTLPCRALAAGRRR